MVVGTHPALKRGANNHCAYGAATCGGANSPTARPRIRPLANWWIETNVARFIPSWAGDAGGRLLQCQSISSYKMKDNYPGGLPVDSTLRISCRSLHRLTAFTRPDGIAGVKAGSALLSSTGCTHWRVHRHERTRYAAGHLLE